MFPAIKLHPIGARVKTNVRLLSQRCINTELTRNFQTNNTSGKRKGFLKKNKKNPTHNIQIEKPTASSSDDIKQKYFYRTLFATVTLKFE